MITKEFFRNDDQKDIAHLVGGGMIILLAIVKYIYLKADPIDHNLIINE